jgi:predicted nuclease of predicted toxin-antitoxin system
LRFLVDMPVTPTAVAHLEARGHEAIHASTPGLATEDDSEILERARIEDRIVVTADLDYPRLLALLEADRPSVILFRGGSYSDAQMLALLDRVLAQSDRLELGRSITVVDQQRIRRRSLPSRTEPLPTSRSRRALTAVLHHRRLLGRAAPLWGEVLAAGFGDGEGVFGADAQLAKYVDSATCSLGCRRGEGHRGGWGRLPEGDDGVAAGGASFGSGHKGPPQSAKSPRARSGQRVTE